METLFELFFIAFISKTVGLYARYYFFKLIGRKKSIKYLSGDEKEDVAGFSQRLANGVVGLISFSLISVAVALLVF